MPIYQLILPLCLMLFCGCSSYFSKADYTKISPQTLSQNSRIALFKSQDNRLTIATRLTYLNDLDNLTYSNREYFFLEIFNDDSDVLVPDSLQISLFGKKPLWVREIDEDEFDDVLTLENHYGRGYLIAFKKQGLMFKRGLIVELSLSNYGKAEYDFSYKILQSSL